MLQSIDLESLGEWISTQFVASLMMLLRRQVFVNGNQLNLKTNHKNQGAIPIYYEKQDTPTGSIGLLIDKYSRNRGLLFLNNTQP